MDMNQSSINPISSLPAEQLALALAIVKLKPVRLSVKEYILQTREHIKKSKDAEIFFSPDRFFDSVAFWKDAYEKSEAEQSKLLDRIYELEQKNNTLSAKVQSADAASDLNHQQGLKRRATKALVGNSTARKKTKTQGNSALNCNIQATQDDALSHPENFRDAAAAAATGPFMRQFYTLQKVLQKRPSHASITQAAITLATTSADEALKALPQAGSISSKGRPRKESLTSTELSHLISVVRSVECAVNLLLQALKKLSATGNVVRDVNLIIYHLVSLYETVMNVLKQYCRIACERVAAKTKEKPKKSSKSKKTAKPKTADSNVGADCRTQPDDQGAVQLAHLLNNMIAWIDLTCSAHKSLLEGFLYVLLSRVGNLLGLFVFQDLQLRPDLRTDSTKLPLPASLADVETDEMSLRAVQMEARYLIWVLEKALTPLNTFTSFLETSAAGNQSSNTQFLSGIKAKLQSTLVHAVFGSDVDLGSPLQRPTQPNEDDLERLRLRSQIPQQQVPDWFMQEVWRLLGWEVLMKSSFRYG
ncbi:hypothetical protein P175DRAFT_0490565 [Aspergillus ochraceoroseus IBT 24754]|uniref:Uncharacterized protein n=3 Tax=Aspergillus subgen. Nidulantes TaxID=2720870 RepID=A0A0F8V447_9EURO|nr:uncharacterized protein P175DRAFT_0490565 [Aspergillus ochraceoroseus IBT 24754]KKK14972.1 hypothetical protein AOCH_004563 [Aspergillus ochraceoroseus]KKK17756.1 hypothetical protein ARAM_001340 [Aspergillus rambellii]PTU25527.1 hypothetical protein P175DRAFT_0490565 [Aspergillus ochraceoroseus IBT 24754]